MGECVIAGMGGKPFFKGLQNNLNTTVDGYALDAKQGKELNNSIGKIPITPNGNLLDNAWFGSDYAINQRKIYNQSTATFGFTSDRWLTPIVFTIEPKWITLDGTGSLYQRLEYSRFNTGTYTVSYLDDSLNVYTHTFTIDDNKAITTIKRDDTNGTTVELLNDASKQYFYVKIFNTDKTTKIIAAKLEEGDLSTISYTTPHNIPLELVKCKGYYNRLELPNDSNKAAFYAFLTGANSLYGRFIFSAGLSMNGRINPTVSWSSINDAHLSVDPQVSTRKTEVTIHSAYVEGSQIVGLLKVPSSDFTTGFVYVYGSAQNESPFIIEVSEEL